MTRSETTYFGLEVVVWGEGRFVRQRDIEALPFFQFWKGSSVGSTFLAHPETEEPMIFLHDWEAFSRLFIATGHQRHDLMATSSEPIV